MLSEKLGRDVFFGTSPDLPRIIEVNLKYLRPNPDQPRQHFAEEALRELADSIRQSGLIQPIAVIADPENSDHFVIVAGERRYRAHQILGRETIAAIVTSGNPDELALIENMQREDLSPIEEAEALEKMIRRHSYKHEDLAKVIGKARTTVTELLSLNDLPEEIKVECRTSDIASKSFLIELVRIGKKDDQLKVWKDFRSGERRTVRAVREQKGGGETAKDPVAKPKKLFRTGHKASVIVQSEISELTPEQITLALREALEQAEKS